MHVNYEGFAFLVQTLLFKVTNTDNINHTVFLAGHLPKGEIGTERVKEPPLRLLLIRLISISLCHLLKLPFVHWFKIHNHQKQMSSWQRYLTRYSVNCVGSSFGTLHPKSQNNTQFQQLRRACNCMLPPDVCMFHGVRKLSNAQVHASLCQILLSSGRLFCTITCTSC